LIHKHLGSIMCLVLFLRACSNKIVKKSESSWLQASLPWSDLPYYLYYSSSPWICCAFVCMRSNKIEGRREGEKKSDNIFMAQCPWTVRTPVSPLTTDGFIRILGERFTLQLIAVPKARIGNLLFGMFSKNSRYLSEFYTDSLET
jgi:hypothetical protein